MDLKNTQTVSLQSRLTRASILSSVGAGLIALLVLFGISVYQTMNMQDDIMDEISDLLMIGDVSNQVGSELDDLSEQFDIQYQLKLGELVLTQSEQYKFPETQPQWLLYEHGHFAIVWSDYKVYRRYALVDGNQQLVLYQPMIIRFEQLMKTVLGYLGFLVLLWLLQWLIVHFMIKKQFRPIHLLSRAISKKSIQDLTPVSQQTPALKELEPIVTQLNVVLHRLETSLEAEQRFTSDASHELRSPLSAIQMRIQLLTRKYSETQPKFIGELEQIQKDVKRGANVLENMLLLARLDPAKIKALPKQKINLEYVIRDVFQLLEPFAKQKNIQVECNLKSVYAEVNSELIFSAIRNIVDNAIRYTTQNLIVSVQLYQLNTEVHIVIENQAEDFNPEILNRMGERFYRELGTKTEGSGLGLSISKKIIQLHQGSIHFKQSELGGLHAQIILPMYI